MNSQGGIIPNRLWIARHRRGLEQKQVAYLLGHRRIHQISRYERGVRLPSLPTALQLELIYGIPLHYLFQELMDTLRTEIQHKLARTKVIKEYPEDITRRLEAETICTFDELLTLPNPTLDEREQVKSHLTALARKLANL